MINRLTIKDVTAMFPNTDKAGLGYLPAYNGFLPEKVEKVLEIGIWKGDGLRMLRHFYNREGEYHAMSYQFGDSNGDHPSVEDFKKEGIICHIAHDDDVEEMSKITDQFDVIVEDASHHSDSQIICFKQMFLNNLKSRGVYFMEDMQCCNGSEWWRDIKRFEDTALYLFRSVITGGTFESQLISAEESRKIMENIESINVIGWLNHSTVGIVNKK